MDGLPAFAETQLFMKRILLLILFLAPLFTFSQNIATVVGFVIDETSTEPADSAVVMFIIGDSTIAIGSTNEEGRFQIDVPFPQEYRVDVQIKGRPWQFGKFNIDQKLFTLRLTYKDEEKQDDLRQLSDDIPTASSSEIEGEESENISSSLNASYDVFLRTTSFDFSEARFRLRGYALENFTVFMNGLPVNVLEDGRSPWSEWSGLNNVTGGRETVLGNLPSTFAFGNIGAAYNIDSRASKQRKQLQLTYTTANRTYRHRLMATWSSGMLKHGWSISLSASRRWAAEGYQAGTNYDGYSYFLSLEKYFGNKHSLALTAYGSPSSSARAIATTVEAYTLAGSHYYNPAWGWQGNKKRSANVFSSHLPTFILTHEFKIDNKSNLITAAGFTFGYNNRTALDWNNAPDPRPDYYRYLPSYIDEDSAQVAMAEKQWRENEDLRQINWQKLYDANAMSWETIDSVEGIPGNTVTGKRARYILEKRVRNEKKFYFATTYNTYINDHVSVSAGLTYQMQLSRQYKKVDDLLGADFYVDVNQFAMRDFPDSFTAAQNDLNHPNRILYEGDKFGYDFVANIHRATAWAMPYFRFKKIDFYVGAELAYNTFWRVGKVKNGLFPDNSEGKSSVSKFFNYSFKAGFTYKIDGRNYLNFAAAYLNRAPNFDQSFVSPRTRNDVVANLKSEDIYSAELGYNYRGPKVKVKAVVYFTQLNNQTKTISYYDDLYRTFVNYTMTGINNRHWGVELAADVKVYKGFSVSGVISAGRYTFSSRPVATVTQDNSATLRNTTTIYLKNFNVSGTPQFASSFGINYRDPKFWFASIHFNYYDWMWLEASPARRTVEAVAPLASTSQEWRDVVDQTRLRGQFIMDVSAGYSWLLNNQFHDLKKRFFLVFNLGVTNITNNKNLVTGGREQLRFDYQNNDINKFPPRIYYGFGTTYYFSIAFRMQ